MGIVPVSRFRSGRLVSACVFHLYSATVFCGGLLLNHILMCSFGHGIAS